ncbi:MAG TPA: DMT family transporter [Mycobacterium sp.]|nr:DMT family transporter [Mycobacterium sp.]
MAKEGIAALLALGAALFIAISDVIQQRTAHEVTDESVGHLALFNRLLHDRRWWLGSLAAAAGFGLQAAALGVGSVLLVAALMVTSLLFALSISARLAHRRLGRAVLLWAALLVGAEAVIVLVGNPTAGASHASLRTWAAVAAVLGPVLLVCLLGAGIWSGRVAAVLLAVVSASSWGMFAVLTKGVVDLLGHGLKALLIAPELYAWAAVALAGTVFQQSSFRAGPLTASLPAMTVVEPLAAAALSVTLLGEVLRPGRAGWLTLAVAVVAMVAATVALSRSEAVTSRDPAVVSP